MWRTALMAGLALALAGCGKQEAATPTAPEAAPKAIPVQPAAPAAAPAEAALPPELTAPIDKALADAQAFDAKAAAELAAIGRAQAKFTAAAGRAYDAAGKGDAAAVAAARREAEAAHAGLEAKAAAFQADSAARAGAVSAALVACGLATAPVDPAAPPPPKPKAAPAPATGTAPAAEPAPGPLAYANCATLQAESAILAKAAGDLAARYDAAAAAWTAARPRLDEAAAMIALR